jgi:hypothetical protein
MNPSRPINESVQIAIERIAIEQAELTVRINETRLNRVLRHITGQDLNIKHITPSANWAILTSYRKFHAPSRGKQNSDVINARDAELKAATGVQGNSPKATREANKDNFNTLVSEIRSHGFGVIRLSGAWQEGGKSETHKNDFFERSILIPGVKGKDRDERYPDHKRLTLDFVKSIGVEFNQDSIIYCGPDALDHKGNPLPGRAVMYDLNGDRTDYEWARNLGPVGIKTPQEIEAALAAARQEKDAFFAVTVPGGSGVKRNFLPDPDEKAKEPDPKHPHMPSPQTQSHRKVGFMFNHVYEQLGIPLCSLGVGSVEIVEGNPPHQRTRWCDTLNSTPTGYGKVIG